MTGSLFLVFHSSQNIVQNTRIIAQNPNIVQNACSLIASYLQINQFHATGLSLPPPPPPLKTPENLLTKRA